MSDSSKTRWTKRRLLTWLKTQPNRYEFDGLQPIPITSANVDHDRVTQGLYRALEFRLRGTNYEALRPGPGIETINGAIRYPDPLVTFSRYGDCYHNVLPYLINVFEVVTPTSRHNDLSIKVREYASILSRRYVVLESSSIKLTMLAGDIPGCPWITTLLTSDDIVRLPQIGIEIPVAEITGVLRLVTNTRQPTKRLLFLRNEREGLKFSLRIDPGFDLLPVDWPAVFRE